MTISVVDAFELVAHSEQLQARLEAAVAEVAKRPGLAEEKKWLATARQRVTASREGLGDLTIRALRLPELEPMRGEYARVLQGAAVEALEKLHGGIALAGGARSPLIEALYAKLKLDKMRRASREDFDAQCTDFEKRLESSYARRMLADPDYAVIAPALDAVKKAIATWRQTFLEDAPPEAEAEALRKALLAAGQRLDVPCRQGRLLAQAALAALRDVLDATGLAQKPKKKGTRGADEDTHPLLEEDPKDPAEPTEEELAELRAIEER